MSFEPTTLEIVETFLYRRFLQWLEVLSLNQELSCATSSLKLFVEWIQVWCSIGILHDTLTDFPQAHDKKLANFATDANSFVSTFRYAISQSTPHIYLS